MSDSCRPAEHRRLAGILDQYYVPTRYPNALPGGVPFETYGRDQAEKAVSGAGVVVDAAEARTSQ